jgi:class 3 adenylate cyclase/predicted ATPase
MTSSGVTMDIGGWLRGLGLGQYEAAFRENEIDDTVLPTLTAEDLKDLGVDIVGHRRKLLNAIVLLRGDAATKPPSPEAPQTQPKAAQDTAERRQITVMFSDLVGSTALSARMDPEDLREVISAYQKCVRETVERFGGFVAKYMGDGVLVYFGYPQAHEDDAERAVRAGLELIEAVGGLNISAPLQTRVGIATGLVVVGDLIGTGSAQEQTVVGETPNLAARLQGLAEPNTVVIAESTRKLVGNLFDLQDLEAQYLKGLGDARVSAWAVLRPASVESRFEALHAGGLIELVGREEELELLLRRWSKGKAGEGQVVLLSGEPGIGKSRLVAALLERLASEPHIRLRYFCSPQHTDSALYPVIGQMERAAGFSHGDSAQVKLGKLDALLGQNSTSPQHVALFADMLSLPSGGRYPALDMTSEQRRQRTLEALVSQVEALSRSTPVLMVFEDAHWTDPTSLEVLSRTIDRLPSLRVLLIVTFRSEIEPPWIGLPCVTALTINRLGQRDVEAIIDHVVGNKLIPASIKQDIIERTDGVPLFVEEITKAVLEAGTEEAAQRTVASVPSPSVAVPASLQASLMARLDRLGSAKEVAQIGATIGREFSHALISAVAKKPEPELTSALARLIGAGLLFRQGIPPHASYLFKHALVQDAAYGTLLREPRRALHARIVDALESKFADVAASQPELLALHCTEAGLTEKAAGLWGKAGYRSMGRSALAEGFEQLARALSQIASLRGTPTLRREEIKLQVTLITPLMHIKGHAALETKAAVERARFLIEQAEALGEKPEDPLLLFWILHAEWLAKYVAFEGEASCYLAEQLLTLAKRQTTSGPLLAGHRAMGTSLLHLGKLAEARTHLDRAIQLYTPVEHRSGTRHGMVTRYDVEAVVGLSYRAMNLWLLGYPEAALLDIDQALNDARKFGQALALMISLSIAGAPLVLTGNDAAAYARADELVTLAQQKGAGMWRALGLAGKGCLFLVSGKTSEAVETITSGIAACRVIGTSVWMPFFLLHFAQAQAKVGKFEDASRSIAEAVAAMETTKELWCRAEVFRIAGEIALLSPEHEATKAEEYFEHALSVARQQQAKSWELRAAMSMARLWRDQGKRDEARELLAPVYGWFTEGFDTRDLREAKALLVEELSS